MEFPNSREGKQLEPLEGKFPLRSRLSNHHVLQASPLTNLLYRQSQSCTDSLCRPPRCVTQQSVCLAYRKPWV